MVIASSNCFPLTHLAAENYDREQLEQSLAITKATMPWKMDNKRKQNTNCNFQKLDKSIKETNV